MIAIPAFLFHCYFDLNTLIDKRNSKHIQFIFRVKHSQFLHIQITNTISDTYKYVSEYKSSVNYLKKYEEIDTNKENTLLDRKVVEIMQNLLLTTKVRNCEREFFFCLFVCGDSGHFLSSLAVELILSILNPDSRLSITIIFQI